jgi:hypothetical protein
MNMEDWETNGFTKFPWSSTGNSDWFIDTVHYEGHYSARSGVISDNQSSQLQVSFNGGSDDSISFYRKVSSEQGYDFLRFYIDDILQGQWSGEGSWKRVAFPVAAGLHIFKWIYSTDVYQLNGSNAAWIDNIVFPPPPLPHVNAGNDTTICGMLTLQLHGTASSYDSIRWSTSGDGTFSIDTILNPIYTAGSNDVISGSVKLRLRADGVNGCYASSLRLAIASIPVPHLSILPGDTVCGGQQVHIFADPVPGGHYFWTPGGFTTPEITADTSLTGGFGSGWFRVLISTAPGCSSSDSLKVTFKDCTGVEEHESGSGWGIYPNPNNGIFTLKIRNHKPGPVTLRLQNALNLTVFEDKDLEVSGNFLKTYPLNFLRSGIYILTLEDTEGKTHVKMIIK